MKRSLGSFALRVVRGSPARAWSRLRQLPGALFQTRRRSLLLLFCLGLVCLTALANRWSGAELSFSIFYLVPISIAAWWCGFAGGILLALASTVLWHVADLSTLSYSHPTIPLWNGVVRFAVFAVTSSLLSRLHAAFVHERALSRTDTLTGAANARTFYQAAALEIERAGRTKRPFTVAYIDIDNFKRVNDQMGHWAGDALLRLVAKTLHGQSRACDLVGRLGGDEFALLLPDTDAAGALHWLARTREAVTRETCARGWPVTCSIGAATFLTPPWDVDAMIQHVDALMYSVKHGGKDRVQHETVEARTAVFCQEQTGVERRGSVRLLCSGGVRVHFDDAVGEQEERATLRDISAHGTGLHLNCDLEVGTVLTVELASDTGKTFLLARVLRRTPAGEGWFYGCELARRLSDAELRQWQTIQSADDAGREVGDSRLVGAAEAAS